MHRAGLAPGWGSKRGGLEMLCVCGARNGIYVFGWLAVIIGLGFYARCVVAGAGIPVSVS